MAEIPKTDSCVRNKDWREAANSILKSRDFLIFHGHYLVYYALALVVSAVMLPIFLLSPFSYKNLPLAAKIMKHVTRIFGIEWEHRDVAVLQNEQVGIIVCNHQNTIDFLGMMCIWNKIGKCVPAAKMELFYVWPFGLSGWLGGVFYLNRKNPKAARNMLKKESERSCTNKSKLWMFAEGTRNRQGQTLLPFKKGAFRMAIEGQVPVLPVVYSPYYFVDEKNFKLHRGGKMVLQAMAPIPTRGLTMDDLDDLILRTRRVMQTAFDTLTEEMKLGVNTKTA